MNKNNGIIQCEILSDINFEGNKESIKSIEGFVPCKKTLLTALNNSEFELYYQPQINIQTMEVTGFESLIRWNHPQKNILTPGFFITYAEQTGAIEQIGEWVIYESCQQLNLWKKESQFKGNMSINISVIQFQNDNFVMVVKEILKKTNTNPESLIFELTESLPLKNSTIIQNLYALRDLGIKLSLDDFGTGYSSLSYIDNLPIQEIKIDRSFIKKIKYHEESFCYPVLDMIINTGKLLNLKVVAEGVENPLQLTYLGKSDCDTVQGYFFSPPMPKKVIPKWLINWKENKIHS